MREKANVVNQKHSETIVNNLLKIIEVKASEGNFSAYLWVKGGRQSVAYQNAQSILTSLGYTISGDIKTGNDRQWLISW